MTRDYVPIDRVMHALRQFPGGATTRQLADHLGMRPHGLANRLSKAFLWGLGVDRIELKRQNHREFIWMAL